MAVTDADVVDALKRAEPALRAGSATVTKKAALALVAKELGLPDVATLAPFRGRIADAATTMVAQEGTAKATCRRLLKVCTEAGVERPAPAAYARVNKGEACAVERDLRARLEAAGVSADAVPSALKRARARNEFEREVRELGATDDAPRASRRARPTVTFAERATTFYIPRTAPESGSDEESDSGSENVESDLSDACSDEEFAPEALVETEEKV